MGDQKLYLEFETMSGAKVSIVIPNAKDEITAESVEDVAGDIVESGLFAVKDKTGGDDAFSNLYSAYYLRTQKTPLQSEDPEFARKGGVR